MYLILPRGHVHVEITTTSQKHEQFHVIERTEWKLFSNVEIKSKIISTLSQFDNIFKT
jgi:hypothetical protein